MCTLLRSHFLLHLNFAKITFVYYADSEIQLWDKIVVVTIHDGTCECRVALVTTSWFRPVISYAPHYLPNKEIMSGFPVEVDELYFVAAYLYASKSNKGGHVALIETCFDVQCLFVFVTFVIRLAIGVRKSPPQTLVELAAGEHANFIISNLLFLLESVRGSM